ncbi:hypothetical protein SUGI_0003260 [Cryptomeria japonica]|nr:hypothetical protein SUGI_0003260 [Cryptomeria japonica]
MSRAITIKETKEIFGIQKEATFKQIKAFTFLVVANGILSCYSLIQLMRTALSIYFKTPLLNKAFASIIFTCDEVITYLNFAAAIASIESAYIAKEGEDDFQWFKDHEEGTKLNVWISYAFGLNTGAGAPF